MSQTQPGDDDPSDSAGVISPGPSVPLARPVQLDTDGVAVLFPDTAPQAIWPPRLSRLRALLELAMLPVVGVVAANIAVAFSYSLHRGDPRWHTISATLGAGVAVVLVCILALLIARQPMASIGMTTRRFWANAALGVGSLMAIYIFSFVALLAIILGWPKVLAEEPVAPKAIQENFPAFSLGATVLITVAVAFWEEVVFRGFLLTRLQALLKRWWLTIPVGAVIFGGFHSYEGVLAMIIVTVLGLIMGLLFVWRRSLVPCIVFHWLHNLIMFRLLYSYLGG